MNLRWVWRGGITLVVGGLLVAGVRTTLPSTATPSPSHRGRHSVVDEAGYSSNGVLEAPDAADLAQVRGALATQAKAVRTGDRAAFLREIDSDRSAFATAQRIVWSNTQKLPFTAFDYTYDGVVEPDTPLRTASFLVHVTTTYQLRGFDASPVQLDDGFTFVKQAGTWKLASVSDADGRFGSDDLPAPWEGPAIDTFGDADYLAIVDRGQEELAHHLVTLCHEASRTSARLLGVANQTPTVVLATTHDLGFKKFTGPDAAAVTYPVLTGDGLTAGWRLVLNPGYVLGVVSDPVVLSHELTHLATEQYLRYLPKWLSEGSAEYVGWHAVGGLREAAIRRGFQARPLPPRLPISADYYLDHVSLNYLQGQALVSHLVARYGSAKVLELLRAYGTAGAAQPSFAPDVATPRILRSVLGISTTELARASYAELDAAAGAN
jgi:hypothetical protein